MNIYPELKKIASLNERINNLGIRLGEKIDADGLELKYAHFITGCKEKNGHLYQDGCRLDNCGLVDDNYYCNQHAGYCEDDFYGTLYFKTNVPGQFVAVPFEM